MQGLVALVLLDIEIKIPKSQNFSSRCQPALYGVQVEEDLRKLLNIKTPPEPVSNPAPQEGAPSATEDNPTNAETSAPAAEADGKSYLDCLLYLLNHYVYAKAVVNQLSLLFQHLMARLDAVALYYSIFF